MQGSQARPAYETVTIARDEAPRIGSTLDALTLQTLRPSKMVVVDDGSEDGTSEVASRYGCELVRLPRHSQSYLGRPQLAAVINAGLARVSEAAEFVVIVDADNPLPPAYMADLTSRMRRDSLVAAASGAIVGEPVDEEMPRNTGFAVKTAAWRGLNGMRYPLMYGYEAWLRLKLVQHGYKVTVYADIVSGVSRGTRLKGIPDGRAMYALGYDPVYAMGRVAANFPSQPAAALKTLVGYFAHGDAERSDISGWVRRWQRGRLLGKARSRLLRTPRKSGPGGS